MKKNLEHLGGGQFDVYREKKSSFGEVVGAIIMIFVVLMIIGAIFG